MNRYRLFAILSLLVFVILGCAAVWMGALNQDEGWYLYAAQMVAEGHLPYRDFFYTQGPILPLVYSAFSGVWKMWGLLGARVMTIIIGTVALVFFVALARHLVDEQRKNLAGLIVFLLLGSNLYHLYYLAIPKTYALASLFVAMGFYLLALANDKKSPLAFASAFSLAFASGTRISLGALLAVVGFWLLASKRYRLLVYFALGGILGLALVYGPFIVDPRSFDGLLAAQRYHTARGGFDIVWTVGSLSRLVRWYVSVFVFLGLWAFQRGVKVDRTSSDWVQPLLLAGFLTVFAIQMLAPFPYEDYQVPIMGLLAVFVAIKASQRADSPEKTLLALLLALGMTWAASFGSPLLERWSTNGQDRFWSLKKGAYELPQLRSVAREIERLDPGGKELLTQDLYIAIETRRHVPKGLEMGPFAMLSDEQWRGLLKSVNSPIAALSGYSFAISPPKCDERPVKQQLEFWQILKDRYDMISREEHFGQNQTTLILLKRK